MPKVYMTHHSFDATQSGIDDASQLHSKADWSKPMLQILGGDAASANKDSVGVTEGNIVRNPGGTIISTTGPS